METNPWDIKTLNAPDNVSILPENKPEEVSVTGEVAPEPAESVVLLSSADGASQVNKDLSFLDKVSPVSEEDVEPKYTSEQYDIDLAAEKVKEAEEVKATTGEGTYTLDDLSEIGITDLTGFDRNDDGTYSPNAKGLVDLGFTGAEEDVEDEEQKALQDDLDASNEQIEGLVNEFNAFDVNSDPQFQSQAANIKKQFDQIRNRMEQINLSRERALETVGYRYGTARYSPTTNIGILNEESRQANLRLLDIETAESAAISASRQAYESGNYTKFSQQIEALQVLRNQKVDELNSYNQNLLEFNKKIEAQQAEMEEENRTDILRNSILGIMDQGFSDPLEILTALEIAGIDATPEDVTKYTSLIQNEDTLAGLDQDLRTYDWLRNNEPEELEDMGVNTYKDYLRVTGDAKRAIPKILAGGATSLLAKAVWDGTVTLKDLTPSQRATIAPELNQKGFKAHITREMQGTIKNIEEGLNESLVKLEGIPGRYKGLFQGAISGSRMLGIATQVPEVADFQASTKIVGMQLTRLFEKGRISDADREFYLSLMPNLRMNQTSAIAATKSLIQQLNKKTEETANEITSATAIEAEAFEDNLSDEEAYQLYLESN